MASARSKKNGFERHSMPRFTTNNNDHLNLAYMEDSGEHMRDDRMRAHSLTHVRRPQSLSGTQEMELTSQDIRRRLPNLDFECLADQIGEEQLLNLVDDLLVASRTDDRRTARQDDTSTTLFSRSHRRMSVFPGSDHRPSVFGDTTDASVAVQLDVLSGSLVLDRRAFAKAQKQRETFNSKPAKQLKGLNKWKHERVKNLNESKSSIKDVWIDFEIWRDAFKRIEGSFGSSVVSYFRFLKWLLWLNIIIAVLLLSVVVLPQVLLGSEQFADTIMVDQANNSTMNKYQEEAQNCSQMYDNALNLITDGQDFTDKLLDFFQGTGWLENQILFYGYYFNRTELTAGSVTLQYNMSAAYLLSTMIYFLISLIAMVRYTAKGVQQRFAQEGGHYHHYFNQVFCGWDYLLAKEKSANFKHVILHQQIINDLEEQRLHQQRSDMTLQAQIRIYAIRLLVHILVVLIWIGCGWVIITVLNETVDLSHRDSVQEGSFLLLIVQFLPSLVITVLNIIVPLFFETIVIIEDYVPQNKIKITIFRTVFLRLASVMVLVISLHQQIVGCTDKACGSCPETVGYCWETFVGQQLYRLVVLDFFVVIFVTVAVELPRKLIVTRFINYRVFQFIGVQEFEIPKNVLDLVYTQTLCWLGAFFSPLIPVITVLKLFVFFYVKKISLFHLSVLPSRPYRASASTFFMVVLMFSFILCIIPVVYSIGRISPSQSCGAFRVYSSAQYTMYLGIYDTLSHWPSVVRNIILFFGSWTFYVPALVIACLFIYYYIAVVSGSKKLVRLLKDQLVLDGRDKQFLLNQVREALHRGDFKEE